MIEKEIHSINKTILQLIDKYFIKHKSLFYIILEQMVELQRLMESFVKLSSKRCKSTIQFELQDYFIL